MSFLTAEWRKLIFANYEIDPQVLRPYVPPKTELDTFEGKHFISLVGFLFKNTRIRGVKIPWHINFEEVNLRFYVRYKEGQDWKRGTVFIREFVPKPAIAFVANTFYNERYATLSMDHSWHSDNNKQHIRYDWRQKGQNYFLKVKAGTEPFGYEEGSEGAFITEHYWGYNKLNDMESIEYEVIHPSWDAYKVREYNIRADFSALYGDRFKSLNQRDPSSVLLMEGSEITIEKNKKI